MRRRAGRAPAEIRGHPEKPSPPTMPSTPPRPTRSGAADSRTATASISCRSSESIWPRRLPARPSTGPRRATRRPSRQPRRRAIDRIRGQHDGGPRYDRPGDGAPVCRAVRPAPRSRGPPDEFADETAIALRRQTGQRDELRARQRTPSAGTDDRASGSTPDVSLRCPIPRESQHDNRQSFVTNGFARLSIRWRLSSPCGARVPAGPLPARTLPARRVENIGGSRRFSVGAARSCRAPGLGDRQAFDRRHPDAGPGAPCCAGAPASGLDVERLPIPHGQVPAMSRAAPQREATRAANVSSTSSCSVELEPRPAGLAPRRTLTAPSDASASTTICTRMTEFILLGFRRNRRAARPPRSNLSRSSVPARRRSRCLARSSSR